MRVWGSQEFRVFPNADRFHRQNTSVVYSDPFFLHFPPHFVLCSALDGKENFGVCDGLNATLHPITPPISNPTPGAPLASEKLLEMKGPREKVDRVADASARPLLMAGPGSSDTDTTLPLALQRPGSQGAFPGMSDPTATDPKPFLSRQKMLCVCARVRTCM